MHPEGRRQSDTRVRQIFGSLLLIAATVIIMIGYRSVPDANTCYPIHLYYREAGLPLSCSTVPSVGYFVAAGLCLVAGLVILARGGLDG
jgi:hypothetical protein